MTDTTSPTSNEPSDGMVRRLSDYDGSRTNNFTTMRIVLAWSVLYGHSYAIAKVQGISDPLNKMFQGSIWVGELAVSGFFAISGFLVAASFVRRGFLDYTLSRILRIFPALVVCVLLSIFGVGLLFTNLAAGEYLQHQQTWAYLKNAIAFLGMEWKLPGVFSENVRDDINGSLWTLTAEVRCYALLAILGLFGLLRDRIVATFTVFALLVFGFFFYDAIPLVGEKEKWSGPALYFLTGVFLYLNRDQVPLNGRLFLLLLIVSYASFGTEWFDYVFPFTFVYLLFYLAYATPFVNTDERLGDISYGIYIYAWPVQQMSHAWFPELPPLGNTIVASIIVIPLAYASWHLLEKPMLGLKASLLRTEKT